MTQFQASHLVFDRIQALAGCCETLSFCHMGLSTELLNEGRMLPQLEKKESKIEDTVFLEPSLQSDTQSLCSILLLENETLCPVHTQGKDYTKCKQEEAVIIWGPGLEAAHHNENGHVVFVLYSFQRTVNLSSCLFLYVQEVKNGFGIFKFAERNKRRYYFVTCDIK